MKKNSSIHNINLAPHLAEIYTGAIPFTNSLRIPSPIFCMCLLQLRPRARSGVCRFGGGREGCGGGRRGGGGGRGGVGPGAPLVDPLYSELSYHVDATLAEVDMEEFYRGDINRILEISGYGDQELYEVRRQPAEKNVLVHLMMNEM